MRSGRLRVVVEVERKIDVVDNELGQVNGRLLTTVGVHWRDGRRQSVGSSLTPIPAFAWQRKYVVLHRVTCMRQVRNHKCILPLASCGLWPSIGSHFVIPA